MVEGDGLEMRETNRPIWRLKLSVSVENLVSDGRSLEDVFPTCSYDSRPVWTGSGHSLGTGS